jgi:hypothetical protein
VYRVNINIGYPLITIPRVGQDLAIYGYKLNILLYIYFWLPLLELCIEIWQIFLNFSLILALEIIQEKHFIF